MPHSTRPDSTHRADSTRDDSTHPEGRGARLALLSLLTAPGATGDALALTIRAALAEAADSIGEAARYTPDAEDHETLRAEAARYAAAFDALRAEADRLDA